MKQVAIQRQCKPVLTFGAVVVLIELFVFGLLLPPHQIVGLVPI